MFIIKQRDGFSLVELLIAVAILGIVSVALLPLFSTSMQGIVTAGKKSTALYTYQKTLEEEIQDNSTGLLQNMPLKFGTWQNTIKGRRVQVDSLNTFLPDTGNRINYVATGSNGTIITSVDGEAWVKNTSFTLASNFHGITWGGPIDSRKFVAVGQSGTIRTSFDGMTWIDESSLITPLTANDLYDVTWNGSNFIAVGSGIVLTSDGIGGWVTLSVSELGTNDILHGVAWSGIHPNITTVAVGKTIDNKAIILSSNDLITWVKREFTISGLTGNYVLQDIFWLEEYFVVCGKCDTTGFVAVLSPDLTATVASYSKNSVSVNGIIFNASRSIAVGQSGWSFTSTDNWSSPPAEVQAGIDTLNDIDWDGVRYITVGSNGALYIVSENAGNWSKKTTGISNELSGVSSRYHKF